MDIAHQEDKFAGLSAPSSPTLEGSHLSSPSCEKGFLECYDFAHFGISLNIVRVSSLETAELKMYTSLS